MTDSVQEEYPFSAYILSEKKLNEFQGLQKHYQEVTLTKHKKLNLERQPCEGDPIYSFSYYVRKSLSKKVKKGGP